jgi:hypothetical protein
MGVSCACGHSADHDWFSLMEGLTQMPTFRVPLHDADFELTLRSSLCASNLPLYVPRLTYAEL